MHLADGRAIVGRNYDYWPMQVRRQRIRFAPDCCALASVGARGGVPCGRYDGINARGLFVSLHVVMTDTPSLEETPPGVPFHLVGRLALELCHDVREARELLLSIPHLSAMNFLLADAREACVIEADPRGVRALDEMGSVTAATNHFRHPDMRPYQGKRTTDNSCARLSFMQDALDAFDARHETDALLDRAQRVMADRSTPLCGVTGSLTTLWSCVAELQSGQIRYAPGRPDQVEFEAIALNAAL
jgi:predicted choloylglycine hydrolase